MEYEVIAESVKWIGTGFAFSFLSGLTIWAISTAIRAFTDWIQER